MCTNRKQPDANISSLAAIKDTLFEGTDETDEAPQFKVGIIGAGVAGLFTAMIFDFLNKEYKINVEYEILEANDSTRLGGRLYTYKFPNLDKWPSGDHEYYDVGAMRFPEINVMDRYGAVVHWSLGEVC